MQVDAARPHYVELLTLDHTCERSFCEIDPVRIEGVFEIAHVQTVLERVGEQLAVVFLDERRLNEVLVTLVNVFGAPPVRRLIVSMTMSRIALRRRPARSDSVISIAILRKARKSSTPKRAVFPIIPKSVSG